MKETFEEFCNKNSKLAPWEWWIGEWKEGVGAWSSLLESFRDNLRRADEDFKQVQVEPNKTKESLLKLQQDIQEMLLWIEK